MMDKISLLDIEGVDPPGDAWRDQIDPDKVRELAESIRSQGLLQPILVRPLNGRYEVVTGHRRYLAHRLIGEVKIKSIIREMTDEQVLEARAVENDQREDLNPIEKAKGYKRLRDQLGYSIKKIAQKMGRGTATIERHFRLLDLPEEFQKAVGRGEVSMAVAIILGEIEDEGFRRYYFIAAVENGVTAEIAERWVGDYRNTRLGIPSSDGGGDGVIQPIEAPAPIYGTCCSCLGPVESNRIRYIPVCPECKMNIERVGRSKVK
jgi:ParB family chromosome partitioning protein